VTEPMLSDDSLAITLLCAHLGSPRKLGLAPLSDSEWDSLAERIAHSALKSPSDMFGSSAERIRDELGIQLALAERIARLLARSGQMAFELDRLISTGIWVLTRADSHYPKQLRRRLRSRMPALFFGLGDRASLSSPGVAVVGSRDLDDASLLFANLTGRSAAKANLTLYSGASRGADLTAMRGTLEAGGAAVGVLADSLERSLQEPQTRQYLSTSSLCLISPFHPNAPFRAGNAMARNKVIYCLASFAMVVASTAEKGGTWAGATEALKNQWIPVFVRTTQDAPAGNHLLLKFGAIPIPPNSSVDQNLLADWMRSVLGDTNHSRGSLGAERHELFEIAWPLIATFLYVPRTEEEVASRFEVVLEQVAAWLGTAESRGLAHRSTHGWLTGSAADPTQRSLFDDL